MRDKERIERGCGDFRASPELPRHVANLQQKCLESDEIAIGRLRNCISEMIYTMNMEAGHLIREARLRAGLRQGDLAAKIGTSQAAIARWEAGDVVPGYDHLRAAIRACGLELRVDIQPVDPSTESLLARQLSLTPKERVEGLRQMIELRSGIEQRRKRDLTSGSKRLRRKAA